MLIEKIKNFIFRARRRLDVYWSKYIWRPLVMKKSGNLLYQKMLQRKPENSTIVITGPGLGDTLYAMAYVHEYHEIWPDRKIIILAPDSAQQIINTYGGGYLFVI